jgi:hypothetical protein
VVATSGTFTPDRIDAPRSVRLGSGLGPVPFVPAARAMEGLATMIRRITGIVLGVVAFLLVYWVTGLGTPSDPNLALSILVGLVVALLWPWVFGLIMVRRVRQNRQNEIDKEVSKQLAEKQNNPPT